MHRLQNFLLCYVYNVCNDLLLLFERFYCASLRHRVRYWFINSDRLSVRHTMVLLHWQNWSSGNQRCKIICFSNAKALPTTLPEIDRGVLFAVTVMTVRHNGYSDDDDDESTWWNFTGVTSHAAGAPNTDMVGKLATAIFWATVCKTVCPMLSVRCLSQSQSQSQSQRRRLTCAQKLTYS